MSATAMHSRTPSTSTSSRSKTLLAAVSAAGLFLTACNGGGDAEAGGEDANGCDFAPDYPSGPVEIIVPWAAGGGTDSVARLVADQLSNELGTQVNVVNRDGGSGVVGHQAMADASPDGQTIGLVTVEIGMMHWQGLTELTSEDLTGIAQINEDPAGITVADDAEWETAQELLDYIEANPGDVVGSGTGQGGIWHLALIDMLLEAGLEPDAVNFVPSDGAAPALQELVAGGVDVTTSSLGENLTMIESGDVRPLAVMGTESDPNFPDVPTLEEETGLDAGVGVWRGIAGPADMDEDVVAELECHIENVVNSEEYAEFMADSGLGVAYADSEEFTALMLEDDEEKGVLMEEAGLAE
ncbi:tripartite tricarboxylate transporter substrate binding protein [Nesterenkonia sphaerica]|uniref:Tripartite tricarboxylate transporter substrate binding protein n=1 Tax=Nesterenkonia sphaerica TaxID=1804988 RepID=A0A5R9AME0_9MICC|nr:tripartite tricarboxylate transporter substrate binding protein [Nesterenkonia sphaerica]TLP79026.1 tripartite tricarboxylate transporter substrate binding protein [Nesterenkonia sphaerica]